MSNIDKQALNQEKIEWLNKLADMEYCKSNPGHWLMSLKDTNMLAKLALRSVALLDELEAAEKRIAELEAMQGKPVMFIDGDISSADADKLAAVIREFKEETETPAARMARIIRENPHPTNMCDMPSAGTGKGE
ncbi:ead/Ea22-like family protein [Escherichia coli]|uniref:ead/Ea22-like family protein n=1 Tax=Escherichia coli TaxID=562 RepID=UPI001CDB1321|nr:ead/Ea22-like family protein [Escherichia coli]